MRHLKFTCAALAAALALSASAALAQAETPTFDEMDRDGDGYVSRTEVMALPCLAERFDAIHPESEMGLNRQEYDAAVQAYCQ